MQPRLGEPTSGAVVWPERAGKRSPGGDRDKAARDIGFVFQEPTLMPWATVRSGVATHPIDYEDPAVYEKIFKSFTEKTGVQVDYKPIYNDFDTGCTRLSDGIASLEY